MNDAQRLWWIDQNDAFKGSPWNATPTPHWNCPSFWTDYYDELLAEGEPWRRRLLVYPEVNFLIEKLTKLGALPQHSTTQTVLDAGCGISLLPHVLAYWGLQVTAIDSCSRAIEEANQIPRSEEELARCVPIWVPDAEISYALKLVDDPTQSLRKLRSLQAAGGSASYIVGDWCSADMRPESFNIIYCRNSLRCSTKPFWRRSLQRFHELLEPGGVLLLENINALGIMYEVEILLGECGFLTLSSEGNRTPFKKYVESLWPTG